MYKELKESLTKVTEFLKELSQTEEEFSSFFIGENVNLVVPDEYLLPIYETLSYSFTDGLLTILPLEYSSYKVNDFTLYGEIQDMESFIYSIQSKIKAGIVLSNSESIKTDLDFFVKVKSIRLEKDRKAFVKAVGIIESLKQA